MAEERDPIERGAPPLAATRFSVDAAPWAPEPAGPTGLEVADEGDAGVTVSATVPGPPRPRRQGGQIFLLYGAFMTVLLLLVGSSLDYASIVVDDARLQNAVDAAALAGAHSLSDSVFLPAATAVAVAQSTSTEYLRLNGYATATPGVTITYAFPTSTPGPSGTPSSLRENLSLTVTQDHPTFFWTLVGINNVQMQGSAGAHAARSMVDIMLSLDTTGSMYLAGLFDGSGRNDFQALRDAAEAFVQQMNPTSTDPRGPRIGIARFAGIKCGWTRSGTGADGDTYIDVRPSGTPNEYTTACTDDMNVLSGLTADRLTLLQIADASGGVACPAGVSTYGCPLKHVAYTAPVVSGTPVTPSGITTSAGSTSNTCYVPTNVGYTSFAPGPCTPTYTGTKLPNGLNVVDDTGSGYYAWSTANGGRNNAAGEGNARKVLVMMTDGQDEGWPDQGPQATPSVWDTQFATRAAALKLGPDALPGTADDVEIFTVAFFCTPYSTSTTAVPAKWCKSQIADTPAPHPCPGPVWPPPGVTPSNVDNLLRDASSSSPGTCDHYYPLGKAESLPQLFQALAGSISRAALTQ